MFHCSEQHHCTGHGIRSDKASAITAADKAMNARETGAFRGRSHDQPAASRRRRANPDPLADAVESELNRLGLDSPALVGDSLGGWVALELARRGRAARAVVISPSGLESPPRTRLGHRPERADASPCALWRAAGPWLTGTALARVMLFGGLRSRPWRLSPDAAAHDLHDFGYSPGFQSTLGSTVATHAAMRLGEIEVPVRVAYGTLDLMLGVFTAPRFAATIPRASWSDARSFRTRPDAR